MFNERSSISTLSYGVTTLNRHLLSTAILQIIQFTYVLKCMTDK